MLADTQTPDTQVTSPLVHQNREETHIWNFSPCRQAYKVFMTVSVRKTNDFQTKVSTVLRVLGHFCFDLTANSSELTGNA